MKEINIAAAQFQTRNGDKEYNLSRIEALTAEAAGRGAQVVSFHECCITSYTFLKDLDEKEIRDLAEEVPSGPSIERLIQIARKHDVAMLAGLVEKEGEALQYLCLCDGRRTGCQGQKAAPLPPCPEGAGWTGNRGRAHLQKRIRDPHLPKGHLRSGIGSRKPAKGSQGQLVNIL